MVYVMMDFQPGEVENLEGGRQEEWILQSPLHVAAYSGDKNKLLQLLEESKERCVYGYSHSIICSSSGDVDEVDENGRTSLMYCAISDQLECLQLMLNRGAVISTQDSSGQTVLHWAAAIVSHM